MTVSQLRRGRWAVGLALLTTASLLLLAVWAVGPQLLQDVGARYGQPTYSADRVEYCPGEPMRFTYDVAARQPGPVEIMGAWCNVDRGNCLLNDTTVRYAIVTEQRPAITSTLTVTIPLSSMLQPGTRWQYVRSVRRMGQDRFDMFTVPFVISESCD